MWYELISIFEQHIWIFIGCVGIFSLLIGSFLNVVIYRLPIMLMTQWQSQCQELFASDTDTTTQEKKTFNLVFPQSHCPHCQQRIKAYQNIPLLSFLVLRGRSACCQQRIAWRYPLIELLTAMLAMIVAYQLGVSLQAVAAIILVFALIVLTFIDLEHQLLPDDITLPLLWLGLFANCWQLFTNLNDAVIGAMAGYLFLWLITYVFKLLTGKIGMGHGDFKLLALFGAWLGWQALPLIIFGSAFVGLIVACILIFCRGQDRNQPIPFGPYLAIAGIIALLWGAQITQFYLQLIFI